MKFLPKFSIKKALGRTALFFCGLLIGAFLFMPWEIVWTTVFKKVDSKVSAVKLSWGTFSDAGPLSFMVNNFTVKTNKGLVISLPQAGLSFGLSPLVELTVDSGPRLSAKVFQAKTLTINGGVDLARVTSLDGLGGKVRITADVGFPDWGVPPRTGSIVLRSPQVEIPGGLIAEDIDVNAVLAGNQFQLNSFSCGPPIPVTAKGQANINWKRLPASTYNISGEAVFGSTTRQFNKSGSLSKYLKF